MAVTYNDSDPSKSGQDTTDRFSQCASRCDLIILFFSIILHSIDSGYDLFLAYTYYVDKKYVSFALTTAFLLFPSVVLTLISIRMYNTDYRAKMINNPVNYKPFCVRIVLCILGLMIQSATLIRNCDAFYFALKSRNNNKLREENSYYKKMLEEQADSALLKICEAYLEAAPQLILQMSLLLVDYSQGTYVHSNKQIISTLVGFSSMAFTVSSYNKSIREEKKFNDNHSQNVSWSGFVVHLLWNLMFTVSRIQAISAVASLYPYWTSLVIIIHSSAMFIWVAVQKKSQFLSQNAIINIFFSAVFGGLYIFNYISFKDMPTRNIYLAFFTLFFVENSVAVTVWGLKSGLRNAVYYIFLIGPPVCFLLSIVFILVYYVYLHPTMEKKISKILFLA